MVVKKLDECPEAGLEPLRFPVLLLDSGKR